MTLTSVVSWKFVASELPSSEDMSVESEDYPLLEAVAKQ
jgi:hypothetical protein